MTSGTAKDILFYSNFCEYSNEVLNLLIRKNITNEFMMVCVDTNKYNLPSFVDRVPIIFTKTQSLLIDDNITRYINELYPSVSEDILPFALGGQSLTNQFSFLEDGALPTESGASYTLIGEDNNLMLRPESNTDDSSNKKGKFDSSQLDKFVQDRDSDLQTFKQSMGGYAR